jgi:hypothetical protein
MSRCRCPDAPARLAGVGSIGAGLIGAAISELMPTTGDAAPRHGA